MKVGILLPFAAAVVILFAGCSKPTDTGQSAASAGSSAAVAQSAATDMPGASAVTGQDADVKAELISPSKTPKADRQKLEFTVVDSAGKPISGAKIDVSVAMTSMDMGTVKSKAVEGKDGHYSAEIEFGMAGPWRAFLSITAPTHKPVTQNLDFDVSG